MTTDVWAGWVIALCSLVLLVTSAAQAALVYIDRARLRHMLEEGTSRSQALNRLLDEPTSTLSAILLVQTVAVVGIAVGGFWLVLAWWQVAPAVGVLTAILGILLLVLLQFLGRLVAISTPTGVAVALVRPVEVLTVLLAPVVVPLVWLEHWAFGALGLKRRTTPADAEDRLRHLVDDNADLEEDEREMIAGVIELGNQPVREVMTPRIDIVAAPADATVAEVRDRVVDSGHSRIPLYQESSDNIIGIVHAKDILAHLRHEQVDGAARELAREPYYVPETKKVDDLLEEMQERRVHLAVVVDEYGGTAGLVTIEDLVEEIVGEIRDEYDREELPIDRVSDVEAVFDARVSIRDVNDTLDIEIGDGDFDTLGGLLYHRLGRVPIVGDEVRVDGGLVTVLSTIGRRVKKVRVTKSQGPLQPET